MQAHMIYIRVMDFSSGFARTALATAFLVSQLTVLWAEPQYSYPLAKEPVLDISFVNPQEGWILKNDGKDCFLFHTLDSGNTWTRLRSGIPLQQVFFLNASHGWATAVRPYRPGLAE